MSRPPRVLFITAPYHAGVVEVAGRWVPLYMVALAGACRAGGCCCRIYDAMTKEADLNAIAGVMREFAPDVVAVSMITATAPDAQEVARAAKALNPAIITIAGGIHASNMYEEVLAAGGIDYVVIGEGEETLPELVAAVTGGGDPASVAGVAFRSGGRTRTTAPRPLLTALDHRPMAWDLLDWEDYTYHILPGSRLGAVATSRGCPHRCRFCSQHVFYQGEWRARSPEDVVREVEELVRAHGVDVVLFTDDYPTPDQGRWLSLLDLLRRRVPGIRLLMETRAEDIIRDRDFLGLYREAGIIHIYIGTEATSQSTLDHLGKEQTIAESRRAIALCREHGIITETSMILGLPEDTPESIERTIEQAIDMDPDFAHFLAIAPWPYAAIYPELAPYVAVGDYRRYNLVDAVVKPAAMSLDEVERAIVEGYRRFYMAKFSRLDSLADGFRRDYILTAVRRMMAHSFIRQKLGRLGEAMPAVLGPDASPPHGQPPAKIGPAGKDGGKRDMLDHQ